MIFFIIHLRKICEELFKNHEIQTQMATLEILLSFFFSTILGGAPLSLCGIAAEVLNSFYL